MRLTRLTGLRIPVQPRRMQHRRDPVRPLLRLAGAGTIAIHRVTPNVADVGESNCAAGLFATGKFPGAKFEHRSARRVLPPGEHRIETNARRRRHARGRMRDEAGEPAKTLDLLAAIERLFLRIGRATSALNFPA